MTLQLNNSATKDISRKILAHVYQEDHVITFVSSDHISPKEQTSQPPGVVDWVGLCCMHTVRSTQWQMQLVPYSIDLHSSA